MMLRYQIIPVLALAIALFSGAAGKKPHVVLIVADDLGWNDVSFHGSRQIPTPNLDALAYDGILLSNYYVQPICTPTRSALMTGRYPVHTGLQHDVLVSAQPYGLGLNEKIMAQYFRELNYSTHMVGKWHLGFHAEEYTPTHRGFESHFGYYQGCGDYYDHTYSDSGPITPKAWGLDFRNNSDVINRDFGKYSTELFSGEAERIIHNHDTQKPLFLYLPHQAVHSGNAFTPTPLEAPWRYQEKVSHIKDPNRRMFAAMVTALDEAVGNVTKALDSKGMLDNTIIVFTTDNGGPAAGFDFNHANNWPLRGLKSTIWEGGTHGAGFLWSPLLETSGYTSDHMMHVTDWLPTLLHPAGYDMKKLPQNIDGMDRWDELSNNMSSYRTEFLYNIDPYLNSRGLRINNMKLIYAESGNTVRYDGWYRPEQLGKYVDMEDFLERVKENKMGSAGNTDDLIDLYNLEAVDNEKARHAFDMPEIPTEVAPEESFETDLNGILDRLGRSNKPKGKPFVITCPNVPANYTTNCQVSKKPCLFDIAKDPCELNNIADQQPDVVKHLYNRLAQYKKTMVKPRNKPVDPKGLPYYHNGVWVPWLKLSDIEQP